ncbi:MAG: hypothetical protein LQ341_005091, partial [Variospora aurantia]
MANNPAYFAGKTPNYYNNPPSSAWTTKVVANHLYIVGCTLAKFSLLAFLYRIFNVNLGFRIASWILAAVLAIWTSVTLLLCIFACKPIRASWDIKLYLAPGTRCNIRVPDVTTIHGFCNVITDFALLFMPVPMVWNLHVGTKKKFGLAAVFATGVLYVSPAIRTSEVSQLTYSTLDSICAVSIVRQYILYNTDKYGDGYYTTRVMVWMDIEFSFSIIVASLPVLTPLFKKLSILSTWLPTLRSKITRSSNHKRSADTSSRGGGGNARHSKGKGQDYDVERNALRGNDKL